ncbi:hypothetical protein [Nocardioides halotolerans]|uniref:hypothetical protein n=1 Tax=Nocardioides halotolerans TaxID=433660 RepID=UPI0012FCBDD6|nr:hypothetical protein [Nocardioides halotolerans]
MSYPTGTLAAVETTWELPYGDDVLQVYAHVVAGDFTCIGFRHWDSHNRFLIRRDVEDETAWMRWMVETEPGVFTMQPPGLEPEGWIPDPSGQVVLDFVNALTSTDLLAIAQSLADAEIEEASDLVDSRVQFVKRAEDELADAERRLHLSRLVQEALRQTSCGP